MSYKPKEKNIQKLKVFLQKDKNIKTKNKNKNGYII
jgi:hypothetical protein